MFSDCGPVVAKLQDCALNQKFDGDYKCVPMPALGKYVLFYYYNNWIIFIWTLSLHKWPVIGTENVKMFFTSDSVLKF